MHSIGYTLGTYVGISVASGLALIFLLGFLLAIAWERMDEYADGAGYILAGLAVLGLIVDAAIFTVAWWPFDMSYHTRYQVAGKVESVNNRMISDGKTMSQRYVFVIDGQPYGVDDTRASITKVGDVVTLVCHKEYTWGAAYGWACDWGSNPN